MSACRHRQVSNDLDAPAASADFDLFVNCTSQSRHQPKSHWLVLRAALNLDPRGEKPCAAGSGSARSALALILAFPNASVRAGRPRRTEEASFVGSYERFLANSRFTAHWVARLWSVPADVVYPPVPAVARPGEKCPAILNVGRFFDPLRPLQEAARADRCLRWRGKLGMAALSRWRV